MFNSINVGTVEVSSSSEVKNLGCWLDNQLKLNNHINRLRKSAFFRLYNIRKIRKFLSRETTQILVNALVTSRLDYCTVYYTVYQPLNFTNSNGYKIQQQDLFVT